MLWTSLFLTLLPLTLAFSDGNPHDQARKRARGKYVKRNHLHKRYRATFYDVGLGACGWYNNANDFIVALNTAQFGDGYPGPNCGRSITISANGRQVQATIADQCPTCGYGELDLSRGLFHQFASEDAGTFDMTWWYNGGFGSPGGGQQQEQPKTTTSTEAPAPSPTPTSTYTPPTTNQQPTTTSTYVASSSSVAPSTTSTTESSVTSAPASSVSASAIESGIVTNGTVLPFVVNTTDSNSTSTAEVPGASATPLTPQEIAGEGMGNLVMFNQAVAYLGHIIVVGAGGK